MLLSLIKKQNKTQQEQLIEKKASEQAKKTKKENGVKKFVEKFEKNKGEKFYKEVKAVAFEFS